MTTSTEDSGSRRAGGFAVLIAIGGIAAGLHLARKANAGDRDFSRSCPPARLELLQAAFDLSSQQVSALRFDGERFWFGLSAVPYSAFDHVRLIKSEVVEVRDTSLPHHTRYRFVRADGGPDRRYSYNPATHTSRRTQFALRGPSTRAITVYSYPSVLTSDQELLANRFTHFLQAAAAVDFESRVREYSPVVAALASCEKRLEELARRHQEAQRILSMSVGLPERVLATDRTIQASLAAANISRDSALQAMPPLRAELQALQDQRAAALREIKELAAPFRNVAEVRAYSAKVNG